MKRSHKGAIVGIVAGSLALGTAAFADASFHEAKPNEFDPAHSFLVQASWLSGLGCPTNAGYWDGSTAKPTQNASYTDPACADGGDAKDHHNEGLILAKTGLTGNYASAYAELKDVKGDVTELGYDIRKPSSSSDDRGSHCGAGAPRFNVTLQDGSTQFVGCQTGTAQATSDGWVRLRWSVNFTGVKSVAILFDEGQDTGPDNFGMAVLDNIDVNGVLVGHGATDAG